MRQSSFLRDYSARPESMADLLALSVWWTSQSRQQSSVRSPWLKGAILALRSPWFDTSAVPWGKKDYSGTISSVEWDQMNPLTERSISTQHKLWSVSAIVASTWHRSSHSTYHSCTWSMNFSLGVSVIRMRSCRSHMYLLPLPRARLKSPITPQQIGLR